MLEKDQEWSNLIVVVTIETFHDNVEDFLRTLVTVEALVHVGLGKSDGSSCLVCSYEQTRDERDIRHEENYIIPRQLIAQVLNLIRSHGLTSWHLESFR